MVADTLTGHAIYSGRARLWQDDSLVEANIIELDRSTQTLTATESVHSVFPQARWAGPGDATTAKTPGAKAKDEYWHTQAQRMTYNSQTGFGHLEGEVNAQSDQGTIRADKMDLFFEPVAGSAGSPGPSGAGATPSGAGPGAIGEKQLVRATADGDVVADQEDRRGTATHADYTAESGKIVLSGGPPAVHDSSGNVTTGRQLTLYFRDDTINVDSASGMRTVTLHRVEK
jgi:lipopolysaccharide export system protein LptA